jgi:integral membrane protein
MLSTALGRFRLISLLEGISYVLLLAIAMPLKYMAGNTVAVPWAGRIHGGLFVVYIVLLAAAAKTQRWTIRQSATAMISSLIPLGAFWLESRLRREDAR